MPFSHCTDRPERHNLRINRRCILFVGPGPCDLPVLLKTLGHPALRRDDGSLAAGLRRKDLALLVYLCVEGLPVHARGRLAGLLWGESPEERARHSLTQALGRVARALRPGIVAPDKDAVRWAGGLACDAVTLLREGMESGAVDDGFAIYPGPFLEGFDAGPGAEEFHEWADRRRAELRSAALRLLDHAGEQAEEAGAWTRALRLGERAAEIDPLWEQGHRRVMRALAARGERNGALRYYQRLEAWLAEEVGGEPDPDTRTLADQVRAPEPAAAERPAPPSPADVAPADDPFEGADPPGEPAAAVLPPGTEAEDAPAAVSEPPARSPAPAEATGAGPRTARAPSRGLALGLALAGALLMLMVSLARDREGSAPPERPPVHGESVRLRGSGRIFLAFGETLYEFPDSSTLGVCTGWYPGVVREIRALPPWPRRVLPSVTRHTWMGGSFPVTSDDPADTVAYVPVGCILPGVPTPETLDSIFGSGARERMLQVPDSVLARLPRAFVARGHPLRPAGTLIRGPDNRVRWITYHGGALEVTDPNLLATHCRSPDDAVSVDEREFRYYRPWGTLGRGSAGCPREPADL